MKRAGALLLGCCVASPALADGSWERAVWGMGTARPGSRPAVASTEAELRQLDLERCIRDGSRDLRQRLEERGLPSGRREAVDHYARRERRRQLVSDMAGQLDRRMAAVRTSGSELPDTLAGGAAPRELERDLAAVQDALDFDRRLLRIHAEIRLRARP